LKERIAHGSTPAKSRIEAGNYEGWQIDIGLWNTIR